MSRKDLTEFIIMFIFSAIFTYFAFTTNLHVLWVVALTLWASFLTRFSTVMLLYSAGITPKRKATDLFGIYILFVINCVIACLIFKSSPPFILLLPLFLGLATGVTKIRFAYLERSGKSKRRLEEIKIYLIVELWFLLLLWTLKCGEISWSKW